MMAKFWVYAQNKSNVFQLEVRMYTNKNAHFMNAPHNPYTHIKIISQFKSMSIKVSSIKFQTSNFISSIKFQASNLQAYTQYSSPLFWQHQKV